MPRTVSIIICTRNKAESLRETLRAISAVEVPADLSAEVIVADNGSTDQTPAVVSEFAASQQKFSVRYVSVPTPGQSRARNAGISAASGEIILFTDDDVRPPSNWIEGMCRPILRGEADATTGTTRIAAHLERQWMGPLHRGYLACAPTPPQTAPLPRGAPLLGANMAFARHVLSRVPAFDERLGPGALGFADDDLFGMQLGEAGFRKLHVVGCEPEHHFDPSRLPRAAFAERAWKQGLCEGYIRYHWLHEDIKAPRLRMLRRWVRLQSVRWKNRGRWKHEEGLPEWELPLIAEVSRFTQYLAERGTPRRYATRRGWAVSALAENRSGCSMISTGQVVT